MDLQVLQLPFDEAIAYLRQKTSMPTQKWDDLAGQYQDVAFTVAQITSVRLLDQIKELVETNLQQGVDVDDFKADFDNLLANAGYSLPSWRSELVISQNMRTSYARGRWEQMRDPAVAQPYWEYRHRDSRVPRPHHKALDGQVFPSNSEIWKGIYPPSFGCRCVAFPISEAEMERRGLKVSTPPDLEDFKDPGFGVGFAELPQFRQQLLKEAKQKLSPEMAKLLGQTSFTEALEAAVTGTLDFAGKKKKKGPNCTPGKSHFCRTPTGRGSCVSAKKRCRYKPDGAAKKAADYVGKQKQYQNAAALDKAAGKVGGGDGELDQDIENLAPELKEFAVFATNDQALSDEQTEELKKATHLNADFLEEYQESKIQKLTKDDLSWAEAAALEAYIGKDYAEMNKALYAPDSMSEDYHNGWLAQNTLAVAGMKKIPPTTAAKINKLAKENNINYDGSGVMRRDITLSDSVKAAFIKKYQAAAESGDALLVEQFLSATFRNDGLSHFSYGSNVLMSIKPKLDGTGRSVLVDKYKNSNFESEVLFKPMTKFKVTKVSEREGKPAVFETVEVDEPTLSAKKHKILKTLFDQANQLEKTGTDFSFSYEALLGGYEHIFTKKEIQSLTKGNITKKKATEFTKKWEIYEGQVKKIKEEKLISPAIVAGFIIEMEEL